MPFFILSSFLKRSLLILLLLCVTVSVTYTQPVSLTDGSAYNQDFNTLSNTPGSTTNNLTITGWYMTETGGGARDNEQYAVDAGASTTGDTYSFGDAGSVDRALGSLRSGTLIPVFGACFTNNTGRPIIALQVSYTGEEWRLGNATSRIDQLNFEYSTNAADLVTGTWTNAAALNFITPDVSTTGAKNGNAAADRTALSGTITGLSITDGAAFWIRWTDVDATGADDGLSVDDFSLTPILLPYVTFTSGSDYTPPVLTPGTSNNIIGRMQLAPDLGDVILTSLTAGISGVHNGITGFNLWYSTDDIFDQASDLNLASAPDGTQAVFNSFSQTIEHPDGAYLFITANLAADADGEITASIQDNSSITMSNGILTGTINNDPLSKNTVPLPVELTTFKSLVEKNSVTLSWVTVSEVNNYGFEVERASLGTTPCQVGSRQNTVGNKDINGWEKIGFVRGAGNSNSCTNYTFTDKTASPGINYYRLKQIDYDGKYTYSSTEEALVNLQEFSLDQNYPNPCNPTTKIRYAVGSGSIGNNSQSSEQLVTLKVYDILGNEVAALVNEHKAPGYYEVEFNAGNLSSGIYFYRITAGKFSATRKFSILK